MIVALLNQKGGVGKTTLALHLAGEWARHGQRVTVIDADPQGSARSNAHASACRASSASSAWRGIRSIAKRRSWRGTPITSSSTDRPGWPD